VTQKPFLG